MIPALHIHLLGDFLLLADNTPLTTIEMPRLQSLLAYLLLHRDTPQSRSHLAFVLWPDSTEAQAHANLRNLVHKLRQTLPHADAFLHVDRRTLQWRPSSSWTLDVLDFEQAVAQAEHAEKVTTLREGLANAVNLYRGDLLPRCYDEWILPERDRLREQLFKVLARLIVLLEQERDYDAAIGAAQRLLRHDPLHEETYRQLMHLYAVQGDRASALRVYHTCASLLERELAVEPSAATRSAYERLVHSKEPTGPLVISPATRGGVAPLVGRTFEWAQMQSAWQRATGGHPHMVLLSGEAGIGKSRLAEELVTWVSRQGMVTASARCYAAEGALAYTPVLAWLKHEVLQASLAALPDIWLSEVARLIPDLLAQRPELPRPRPIREGWQLQHLFEALARVTLGAPQPLLLVLDDLQWADSETLEWLHYLLRFDPQARLLLVGTIRAEEVTPEHSLTSWLASIQRESKLTELALGSLDAAETATLAEHVTGKRFDSAMMVDLYQETEGNPLFVVETVRAGAVQQHETLQRPSGLAMASASALPTTVQTVLSTRLAQLSTPARELVGPAAVIGRAFTFSVLMQASGSDEDTLVRVLDELWQRRIVREQGGDAYDFSHDKLREAAYASLSTARRRLLHRRVAEALEVVHASDLDSTSGQLAMHYEHAGLAPQAIVYYQRAGEVAQRVYAHAEAIASFRQALTLLEATSPGAARREQTARLHERIGDSFTLIGQHIEARNAYQSALAQVTDQDRIRHGRLYRKIGDTWNPEHLYKSALHAYDTAEIALAPTEDSPDWWQEWLDVQIARMEVHHWQNQSREFTALVEKIQPMVEQYGTPAQRAGFFAVLSANTLQRERYVVSEEALAYAHTALAASQQSEDSHRIVQAQHMLAFYQVLRGDLAVAEEHLQATLALSERTGELLMQALCLLDLILLYRKRGQVHETRHYSLRALALPATMIVKHLHVMARANLAWVAWCEGNLPEMQLYARAAIELWEPLRVVFPLQWTVLWPLVALALTQDRLAEALEYAHMLLSPEQQPLPEPLTTVVESAVQGWDADRRAAAYSYLQEAVALAQQMGYL